MEVLTCYKVVPDEQDISVNKDRTLSLERAEWKIGQYDLNAVEAGMQIVQEVGGKVSAISVGDKQLENSKLRKSILSRGPEELYIVVDDCLTGADTYQTASLLASSIIKKGHFDLVLCGEGSADLNAQQIGNQLGELLNVPTVNAVSKITPAGDKLIVERTLEDEVEVLEVPIPAVISVTTDINIPRIPSLKEILAAGKRPVTKWNLADIGVKNCVRPTEMISTLAPEQVERKQIILEGEADEAINKFFEDLRKEIL